MGWIQLPDGRLLCRRCSEAADCPATGHQMSSWSWYPHPTASAAHTGTDNPAGIAGRYPPRGQIAEGSKIRQAEADMRALLSTSAQLTAASENIRLQHESGG